MKPELRTPPGRRAPLAQGLGNARTQDGARTSCLTGEGERGGRPAGVLKGCGSAAPRGGKEDGGRPTAKPPLTLEPLGLRASLSCSPCHLQTTLLLTQQLQDGVGAFEDRPRALPLFPRKNHMMPRSSPLWSPKQVFRESGQQRPQFCIKQYEERGEY